MKEIHVWLWTWQPYNKLRWRLPSKIIKNSSKIKVLRDCQREGSYAFQETIRKWVLKNQTKNSNNWQQR
jgi:hypothetical protein